MERALVLLAAGDEQDIRVLGREQCLDRVLPPQLAAVRLHVAEAVVRIDGLVAARRQLADDAGLARAGQTGQEHALHARSSSSRAIVASISSKVVRGWIVQSRRATRPLTSVVLGAA